MANPLTERRSNTISRSRLTVSAARDWRARWDEQQDALIPDRAERFEAILETLAVVAGNRFDVLDLGCGTGSLSERIVRRFPRARSVAVDHDPVLLAIGHKGLGDMNGRLTWVDADLRQPDWYRRLPRRRFHAAVSTTALHWLTPEELSAVYARVARLLPRGGWFLDGDHIAYPSTSPRFLRASRLVRRRRARSVRIRGVGWGSWWRTVLRDPRLAAEAKLHRLRYPRPHSEVESPDLDGHIRRLRTAGFREVHLIWTRWENRVLAAVR